MNKKIFAAALVVFSPAFSYGQTTKFVTLPNGGMVPCNHPLAISAGLTCSTPVTITDYNCDGDINPYLEPDRAAFCSIKTRKTPSKSEPFRIGEKYYHPYGDKMVVIGVVRDIRNNEIVIFQIYEGPKNGVIYTFMNVIYHNLTKIED